MNYMTTIILTLGLIAFAAIIASAGLLRRRRWVQCAWCNQFYSQEGEVVGFHEIPSGEHVSDSHGICQGCSAALRAEMNLPALGSAPSRVTMTTSNLPSTTNQVPATVL